MAAMKQSANLFHFTFILVLLHLCGRFRLIGKHVVGFLLVLIELFSLGVMAEEV